MRNKNFFEACTNAIKGVIYNIKTQGNIRKQVLILIASIVLGLMFKLNTIELILLIFSSVLIIIIEMVNTAIETTVDLFCDIYHPKAKIAKDVGAGATLVAAINYAVIFFLLFFDKIVEIYGK